MVRGAESKEWHWNFLQVRSTSTNSPARSTTTGGDYFIPDYIRPIGPRHQHAPDLADILREMGAPQTCRVTGGERDDACGEVPHDGGADALYASPEILQKEIGARYSGRFIVGKDLDVH